MKRKLLLIIAFVLSLTMFTACSKSIEQQITDQLELGQRYLSELNFEEAIVAFQKVIELDPKNSDAYIRIAESYMGQDDGIQAIAYLEQGFAEIGQGSVSQDYKDFMVDIYLALIKACKESGDSEAIRKYYDRILEINPDYTGKVEKIVLSTYFDEDQEGYYEFATVAAYSNNGDIVWSYEPPKCTATELEGFVELGQKGNCYYLVEDTSVVCIDVQSGTILWKNDDYAGRASGFALGDNAIYLCGQYGPDFYAITYTGETLVRIDQFDPSYYWAEEIELQDGRAAVYLHGGTSDYDNPRIFYVDLNTYTVMSEQDQIKSDTLSIDELSRLLNDYFATYQWEDEDILSGSVFNGIWLNDTEALFDLRVETKSAEWTHQANQLAGRVSIDARSLTGYIEWNDGTRLNINL